MKIPITALAAASLVAFTTTSCMTTYDAYGRPVQSVDPGLAVAGIAAAGLVGYALASDNDDYDDNHYHGGNYHYRRPAYRHHGYNHCSPHW